MKLTRLSDGFVQDLPGGDASIPAGLYRIDLRCDAAHTLDSVAITEWGHTTTYPRGAATDDMPLKIDPGDRFTLVVRTMRTAAKPAAPEPGSVQLLNGKDLTVHILEQEYDMDRTRYLHGDYGISSLAGGGTPRRSHSSKPMSAPGVRGLSRSSLPPLSILS